MRAEFLMNFGSELAGWMASRYGLDLTVFGQGAVDEALGVRCRSTGMTGEEGYVARWREDGEEREAFLDELLVGETWFFREWPAFHVLGEWLATQARRFSPQSPLRVLALPCATGEEAWSIAAIVQEGGLDAASVVIDAMDINHSALEFAERGRYPQRRLRSQPVARWAHVLRPRDGEWIEVDGSLRGMVRFIEANAMDRTYLLKRDPYHVIFCRNMLIYMGGEARSQVCETLAACLDPEGLLFLGHAEQLPPGLGLVRTGMDGAFAWRPQREAQTPKPPGPVLRPLPRISDVSGPASRTSRSVPNLRPALKPATPIAVPQAATEKVNRPSLSAELSPPTRVIRSAIDLESVRQLADQGRYLEAFKRVDSIEARASLDPEVHSLAGILLGALDRKAEAVSRLRRALYLDPGHAESLAHLALLIEESGDAAGAGRLRARLADPAGTTGS
jgi:chemotaxis protein methyltransferase WspC